MREEQLISVSISDSFSYAWKAERKLARIIEGTSAEDRDDPGNLEYRGADEALWGYLEKIFRDICILAERLNLPLFRADVAKAFRKYEKKRDTAMSYGDFSGQLESEPLGVASGFFASLRTITRSGAVTGLSVFRRILRNTPSILRARKIEPSSEADVRKAVFEVLQFSFDDAVREIPIAKIMKTYKPDLGVRSLLAAAEYKYAATELDVKRSLDEIYTDMKGYSGHSDWRNFFAVIYTTDAILSQEKLEAQFREVRADTNWEPIIITGAGGKKKKASASK